MTNIPNTIVWASSYSVYLVMKEMSHLVVHYTLPCSGRNATLSLLCSPAVATTVMMYMWIYKQCSLDGLYSTSSINGIHYHHKRSLVTFTSYTLNRRTADGQTYWRCQDRSCSGRVVTDTNDQLVTCNDKHTHPPKATETALEMVKERMKERAKEETTPIPRIIMKHCRKWPSMRTVRPLPLFYQPFPQCGPAFTESEVRGCLPSHVLLKT